MDMLVPKTKLAKLNKPVSRKLRAYAFDPSLSLLTDTVQVNNIVYKVEWEELQQAGTKTLPAGEYIEIIDYDPASGVFYPPVDLNDPYLLAQDGLNPSVSNPQFHQQMVYAVIMTTIKNFERALGRKIQWSPHIYLTESNKIGGSSFVQRLRIYPHALRQANAYYNPQKKSLLFGYFPAKPANVQLQLPGGTVFTCLSHDVIAHETTHAILDGLHQRYIEDTHPDTRAFHEAFSDIVALFQHFTFPEVLKHQIAKTKGDLNAQNLLGQLAQQFGLAMGSYGSLRDAIGKTDPVTGEWTPQKPDPEEYATKMEFHDRGAVLVAAIFDAFLNIYKQRIKPLLRVSTGGEGDLHPDMVDLLANTASDTASRILKICVRALDYCPPVDINYGDYLRALITADVDMVAEDEKNYRVAFIESFQKRGIFPTGVKTMSVESLVHEPFPEFELAEDDEEIFIKFLKEFKEAVAYETSREKVFDTTKYFISGDKKKKITGLYDRINSKFILSNAGKKFAELSGLLFPEGTMACEGLGFGHSDYSDLAKYSVENLWLASRITPDDKIINHVIINLVQKRGIRVNIDAEQNFSVAGYFDPGKDKPDNGFIFRGGCTLIFDLDKMQLKYAIKKGIDDVERMERQYKYKNNIGADKGEVYFSDKTLATLSGPFAFMHSFTHQH
ncbi:hypothetical protein SAMN05428988_5443 [Chitinophaga sp. YR573]|uniref:hypothetical protein n=1 Tax=Chitinophaga sp. YR573 TaxID=1881040 RepID=UPI0008D3D1D0|nr:hypothetical protein [Chitinophaga sp. YR573]SEW42977.1 hypothetical protein SAMN05428988_5443 [Chitinophaga sp. YR573]